MRDRLSIFSIFSGRLLLLGLGIGLSFCNKNSNPDYFGTVKPMHPADELVINASGEPQYLDPAKVSDSLSSGMVVNMFVRLTESDPKTGESIPSLAKSWEISKDGKEYTFHLREDALWSDGKPITAEDVVWSWGRVKDPQTGAVYSEMINIVQEAKAIDSHTLSVKLRDPAPYFLGLITYPVFAPVPRHMIEKLKAEKKEDLWVRPENIVVSGPFILTEENFKQYKIFKKNPKYFDASKVRLNQVKTVMIEDYNADMNAYKTGQHDWSYATSIPLDMIDIVKKYKDFHVDPQLAVYFYMLNTKRKPLDDVRVRKALSLAIDRAALVKNVTRGGQIPTRDMVPEGMLGYPGLKSSIYEPEQAKKLLSEAGFPGGKDFPKIAVKFNTSEGHRKIAEAIQQMWQKVLGVQINIENMEWRSLLDDQNQSNFDILRSAWTGDYLDPNTFLSIMTTKSKNNHTNWGSAKFDQALTDSDRLLDKQKRFDAFLSAEKILAEESPIIPVYAYTRLYMKKSYLKGFWPNLQDRHEWKYMWIDSNWDKNTSTAEKAN